MKTIQITLTLVLLVWASILNAQKFEGKIAFKTEFTELPAEMESMKSMMEMNITTYVKGNLSRTETKGMMTPEIINIMDLDKKLMTTLMDQGGKKTAIVTQIDGMQQEMEADGGSEPQYKETGETKSILGFACNKVIVTKNSPEIGEMKIEMWYTKEITNNSPEYSELKGMPLETNIPIKPGMVMHMVATEVKSEKVDASKFIVPEGYEITTMEEVQKKMSGKD
jgi:GLPGLI family protein